MRPGVVDRLVALTGVVGVVARVGGGIAYCCCGQLVEDPVRGDAICLLHAACCLLHAACCLLPGPQICPEQPGVLTERGSNYMYANLLFKLTMGTLH